MKLDKLAADIDTLLKVKAFADSSHNGLQLANKGTVTKICTGVDASLRFFEEAVKRGADCVLVHHGLSWGDSLTRITGRNYDLISFAVKHNLAVYGCHLPLDAHPTLGNNVLLAKCLGVKNIKPFYDYHGATIGVKGTLNTSLASIQRQIALKISPMALTLPFGKKQVKSIGIVSGGASDGVEQAALEGLDLFLTGESGLVGYNFAEHYKINAIFAGHYATEVFGVRALGEHIAKRHKIPVEFIDFGIPV